MDLRNHNILLQLLKIIIVFANNSPSTDHISIFDVDMKNKKAANKEISVAKKGEKVNLKHFTMFSMYPKYKEI